MFKAVLIRVKLYETNVTSVFGNLTWTLGPHLCNELVCRHQRCPHPCVQNIRQEKGEPVWTTWCSPGLHTLTARVLSPQSTHTSASCKWECSLGSSSCPPAAGVVVVGSDWKPGGAPCVPNCCATHAHRMTVAQEPGGTPASSPTSQGTQGSFAGLECLQSLVSVLAMYAYAGRIFMKHKFMTSSVMLS